MLTPVVTPDIPDFLTDKLGQEIRPGDRIVYATAVSSSAYLNVATVLNFQYSKQSYYGPILKIRVEKEGGEKPSLINANGGHYVKVGAKNVD